jgi:hypothetical protein
MTLRRKWLGIALASMVMTASYWLVVFAAAAGSAEDGPSSTQPFTLGLILVPFAFIALAFLTRQRDASWAVVKAMGLFLVVGLPIGLFNVVIGMVAGFGAGAVVAVRTEEGVPYRKPRSIGVLVAVLYTLAMLAFVPPLGVFTGSVVPFAAVGIADQIVEGRLADRAAAEGPDQ